MTQERRDNQSTEYGIWLRQQKSLDSNKGFIATNIDYFWQNYQSGKYLFMEEKRYGWMPKRYQVQMFKKIDKEHLNNIMYMGFHLIVFEKTSPDDGLIWLDGALVTKPDLITFLQFDAPRDWYNSYFPDCDTKRLDFDFIFRCAYG